LDSEKLLVNYERWEVHQKPCLFNIFTQSNLFIFKTII